MASFRIATIVLLVAGIFAAYNSAFNALLETTEEPDVRDLDSNIQYVDNEDDDGVLGGAVGDALPGFGLMAGMAALAMAAVAGSRINRREE